MKLYTDFEGQTELFVYDASGTTTYTYNAEGQETQAVTPEGTINYVFDPATGNHIETYTNDTQTFYGYDSQSQLTSVTVKVANGTTLSTPLTTNYTYDAAGNLVSESDPSDPNGMTTAYTYDDENRMLTETVTENGTTPLFEQTYMYYDNGLKESDVENDYTSGTLSATIEYDWQYDNLGRLTQEQLKIDAGTASVTPYTDNYTYDLDGNRLSQSNATTGDYTSYTYNGDDELTQQVDGATGLTTFTYDANGSQTSSTNGGNVTTYTYNLRGKLSSVTTGGSATTYVYDDAGNRVRETTGGVTSYYLTDTNNATGYAEPIEVRTSMSSLPVMTYLIGNDVYGQMTGGGTVSYYLTDGHGSTRETVNSTGGVVATFNYDAFGGAINFTPSASTPIFLFGGDAVYDYASGLYMNGDGTRDRSGFEFIQMDPTSGEDSDPMSLHKYLYANADPIMYDDPSGHDGELGELLLTMDIGLSLDYSAAVTPYAIARAFGLVSDVPSSDDQQESSWFNGISDDLAVFGGYVQGFAEGAAQGFFNVVNGIQDAIIGTANLAIKAELATLGPVGLEFNVSIPSPDWSYGLVYDEPPTQHAVSKFLGGIGASLASSGGFGILGAAGEGALSADELSLTETVANNAATRPYVNSRLLAQEIMDSGPGAADPGGIPGGLRWDVEGAFNGSKGVYQLVVNPATKQIVHFLFTSS